MFLGGPSSGSYSALVIAGTYDLAYSADPSSVYNMETILQRGIVVG